MRVRFPHSAYLHPSLTPGRRDEYGQVKSVKLLRRGRRLQQAEYVLSPVSAIRSPVGLCILILFVIQGPLRQGQSRR